VDALGAEPASQRRKLLEQHLRQTLGTILAIPPHELDPDVGFTDLGLDSMMAVQLRKRLQLDLGAALALPVTIAFDYPSVHQLATFVLDQLYPVEVEAPELDEFQQKLLEIQTTSSEDELDALLETNLKALGAD
jgi:acyl carrier protein